MAQFIDTATFAENKRVIEGQLQEKFLELLQDHGGASNWTLAKKFNKVTYNKIFIAPNNNISDNAVFDVTVAKHYIFQNAQMAKTYLGMVITGCIAPIWRDVPVEARPVNSLDQADQAGFVTWIKDKVKELETQPGDTEPKMTRFYTSAVVYFYLTDRLPSVSTDTWHVLPWESNDLDRGALDVEVWKAFYESYNDSYRFVIKEPELHVMQSPISKVILRYNKSPIEDLWSEQYNISQNDTNWWYDSEVHIQGFVDEGGFFLLVQADTVPAWEDNITPSVPLYFGKVDGVDPNDDCIAFFAGTTQDDDVSDIPRFDMDDPSKATNQQNKGFQDTILPILKKYPRHPSNGVDTVMVKRSKFGARYQCYYLSWNTAPNVMPPDRSNTHATEFTGSIERDYPRAWNQYGSDEYKYWFNPSRYSKKIHTSKIYIVNPEEGVRGSLRYSIGLSPIGISAGNRIRVLIDPCDPITLKPVYEYYRYLVVDGISPLTKRPGTAYRPIGLGIKDENTNE